MFSVKARLYFASLDLAFTFHWGRLAFLSVAIVVLSQWQPTFAQSLTDLDPTNKNSALRGAARDIEREARTLGRDIGRLNPLPELEKRLSETAYYTYKAFVENKQVNVRVVRLRPGDFHFEIAQPLLPQVNLVDVTFYFDAFVPADMAAVTFGSKIYVDHSYDPNDESLTHLLVHELVHVAQYNYLGGEKEFAQRYLGQISKATRDNILSGNLNVPFVHNALGLEKEAESYAFLVPNYNYRRFTVNSKTLEAMRAPQLKQSLEQMNANELGASLMQIDGPTLKVGLELIDGPTLQVAVDKMDMPTLREGMIRVDGPTLTEILKRLHPTKRTFILGRLDDATRRETDKREKHWRK